MNRPTGGPAFPCHSNPRPGHLPDAPLGMTLRDYFAARVMQALITHPGQDAATHAPTNAEMAYAIADAMLAARARP